MNPLVQWSATAKPGLYVDLGFRFTATRVDRDGTMWGYDIRPFGSTVVLGTVRSLDEATERYL